ncbi:MAG: alpha/beta fold hydrolase [Propionibacteriales bacterium]|nr:alpha/beta fold hydrolase [Propionibacteriales bacterium]
MSKIRTTRNRSAGPADATARAVAGFLDAQQQVFDRYRVKAEHRFVMPTIGGCAQVLVAGEGPPLPMVIGGTVPAAFWAPLMAKLPGHTLYAIELPGFGLTDPVRYHHTTLRRTAVAFLGGVLEALGLDDCQVVSNSMGARWSTWLSADQPGRIRSEVMIGCPAHILGTTAPAPMRLASVPGLGRALVSLPKPSAKGVEQMLRAVGEDPNGLAEIRDVLVAAQRIPTYSASMLGLMRAVMRWTRLRPEVELTADQLRQIRHPVRLIWGEQDPFGSVETGRRATELIPEVDFHAVPGGHAPWFHHADLVAGLTGEFLDTHAGGGRR